RGIGGSTQDFQVWLDTTLLGTFQPTGTSYQEYATAAFTTTAGAHTLKFIGRNTVGGDNTAFIDNVRVSYTATAADVEWLVADQCAKPYFKSKAGASFHQR